jgi:hypothetical protein
MNEVWVIELYSEGGNDWLIDRVVSTKHAAFAHLLSPSKHATSCRITNAGGGRIESKVSFPLKMGICAKHTAHYRATRYLVDQQGTEADRM